MQSSLTSPNDYFLVNEFSDLLRQMFMRQTHTSRDQPVQFLSWLVGGFLVNFCQFLWRERSHHGFTSSFPWFSNWCLHSGIFNGVRQNSTGSFPWKKWVPFYCFVLTVLGYGGTNFIYLFYFYLPLCLLKTPLYGPSSAA